MNDKQFLEFKIEYVVFNENNLPCYYEERLHLNKNFEWNIEKIIFVTMKEKCEELGYKKAALVSFSLLDVMEITRK